MRLLSRTVTHSHCDEYPTSNPQSGEYQLPAVMLGSIGLLMLSLLHVGVTGLVFLSYYHLKVGQGGGLNMGAGSTCGTCVLGTDLGVSLPAVSPPPPSPLLAPPFHQAPVLLFKHEKNIAHKLKVSKTWVLNPPRTSKERWDSLVLRSPSFPRLAIDVHLKDRVCVCVHTGVHLERGGGGFNTCPPPPPPGT